MSLMKRISLIFRSKANKALDKAEDPRETLDYSYQRQLDLLAKVRRGVADVATSRKRVELQASQLQSQSAKLQEQAQKALSMGREDLARAALAEKQKAAEMAEGLHSEISQIEVVLRGYEADIQRLQAKLAEARARQNAIASRFESAMTRARTATLIVGRRRVVAEAAANPDTSRRHSRLTARLVTN